MRRLIAPVVCSLLLFPLAACGADDGGDAPSAGSPGVEADGDGDLAGAGVDTPAPPCPFTADKITELVGQSMVDQGSCSFGDGKGVALLTITTASRIAGEATYDYQRQQATSTYREVKDAGKGDKGYLATKDIGAEAVVISNAGSYTVTLSSFERLGAAPDGYERTLRGLLDALPL
ncbi:hypothetical protein ACFOOK_16125 [Micromonospora krabiensis]|uniref:DUF3558 domain-containing protein n=1 Tax=Micromonospora krabiensis TaxID=307121 RepID=A0A1C3N0C6_9ACTN|nr:hypothetical protein [Micromonospora krabiensis]SBV26029.1 hypothetical protein GA0070620_1511 [Micromonospora krabiensis]